MLPNALHARIDPRKILEYLLSETHPTGRHKAKAFRSLGFEREHWSRLALALKLVAISGSVESRTVIQFGTLYLVSGVLIGPSGIAARFRTVWIVPTGESAPRLVTAYPE